MLQLGALATKYHEVTLFTWLPLLKVSMAYLLDPLSSVMILVVTGIGFLIHVYSIGYMAHEGGYYRFFGYLNLFIFFMLTLVLANNYALMFVGWEGVGLCSYLLIGFYFIRNRPATRARKRSSSTASATRASSWGMFLLFRITGIRCASPTSTKRCDRRASASSSTSALLSLIGAAAVHRRDRQIGADSAVRLAAGRDGRPDAGVAP